MITVIDPLPDDADFLDKHKYCMGENIFDNRTQTVNLKTAALLQADEGLYSTHHTTAWEFYGYVYYDEGHIHERVRVNNKTVAHLSADSPEELMLEINRRYLGKFKHESQVIGSNLGYPPYYTHD